MTLGAIGVPRSHPDYRKLWYQRNRAFEAARAKAFREGRRRFLDAIKMTAGCADCGYRENPVALDFDHVEGQKVDHIGTLKSRSSIRKLVTELEKCEVVCANCHRIRTFNRLVGVKQKETKDA